MSSTAAFIFWRAVQGKQYRNWWHKSRCEWQPPPPLGQERKPDSQEYRNSVEQYRYSIETVGTRAGMHDSHHHHLQNKIEDQTVKERRDQSCLA